MAHELAVLHGRLIALSSSFQDRAAVLAPTFQVALALAQVATAFLAFTLIQDVKLFGESQRFLQILEVCERLHDACYACVGVVIKLKV